MDAARPESWRPPVPSVCGWCSEPYAQAKEGCRQSGPGERAVSPRCMTAHITSSLIASVATAGVVACVPTSENVRTPVVAEEVVVCVCVSIVSRRSHMVQRSWVGRDGCYAMHALEVR